MPTFTTFAFGTGEKSTMQKKNIISQFSENCTGDHQVVEGPDLLGREVAANVKNATRTILQWLRGQDDTAHNINLTGFSRGAVTCIQIANRLKRYERLLERNAASLSADDQKLLHQLKNINVNIFAMDPVAGMGDKAALGARIIPDNVKSYVALLQTDEMRRDFKPQDLSRIIVASPKKTSVSLLPMYGNHSDTTKIKSEKMQSGPKLAWYALHQFLSKNGTTFKGDRIPAIVTSNMQYSDLPPQPTNKDLLQLFSQHHQERSHFLTSGTAIKMADGMPIARKMRSLNKHLEYYVKNADFFSNQLERELFKVSYPKAFNYLFERNQVDLRFPTDSASSREEVIAELTLLRAESPELFARLQQVGVTALHKQVITLGDPSGVYCLEPCASLRQIFPDRVHPLIRARTPEMNRLAELEADIYRLTFRYEREKSDLSPFQERAQAERTKSIRETIKAIVDETPGDDRTAKYERVLDFIQQQFIKSVQSTNGSELSGMLQRLLLKHGRHYQINNTSIPQMLMAKIVYSSLSLIKETINFVGNLGYVGGAVLSAVGMALQDFGRRINDAVGTLGYNPFKYVVSAIAYAFEGIGFAIKNSFGLKPLTNFISSCITTIRDAAVIAIGPINVQRVDQVQGEQDRVAVAHCRSIKERLQEEIQHDQPDPLVRDEELALETPAHHLSE